MITFIIGAVIGAVAVAGSSIIKRVVSKEHQNENSDVPESNTTSINEGDETLKKRNAEAERRIEELTTELLKVKKKLRSVEDLLEESVTNQEVLKSKVRQLQDDLDESQRKVRDYQIACNTLQNELKALKE